MENPPPSPPDTSNHLPARYTAANQLQKIIPIGENHDAPPHQLPIAADNSQGGDVPPAIKTGIILRIPARAKPPATDVTPNEKRTEQRPEEAKSIQSISSPALASSRTIIDVDASPVRRDGDPLWSPIQVWSPFGPVKHFNDDGQERNPFLTPSRPPRHSSTNMKRNSQLLSDSDDDPPSLRRIHAERPLVPSKCVAKKPRIPIAPSSDSDLEITGGNAPLPQPRVKEEPRDFKIEVGEVKLGVASTPRAKPDAVSEPEKRAVGRPPGKAKEPPHHSVPGGIRLSLYLEIPAVMEVIPSQRKGSKAAKIAKPPSEKIGPGDITDGTTYTEFLATVVSLFESNAVTVASLQQSTFRWSFAKNGKHTGSPMPLTNQKQYEHLIVQIRGLPVTVQKNGSGNVVIEMEDPRPRGAPSQLNAYGTPIVPSSSQNVTSQLNAKIQERKAVDGALAPYIAQLELKYPIGTCKEHPFLRCFAYALKNWHFELDENRLSTWAHALEHPKSSDQLQATWEMPPLGNMFFKHSETIDYHKKKPAPTNTFPGFHTQPSPVPPALAPYFGQFPMMASPSTQPFPQMFSPWANPGTFTPQNTKPTDELLQWCLEQGLGSEAATCLTNLGFKVGAPAPDVNIHPSIWTAAGFKYYDWTNFIEVYSTWWKKKGKGKA